MQRRRFQVFFNLENILFFLLVYFPSGFVIAMLPVSIELRKFKNFTTTELPPFY